MGAMSSHASKRWFKLCDDEIRLMSVILFHAYEHDILVDGDVDGDVVCCCC